MAYKSKYYDPAKAHEYYMKHRKLKGRKKKTSTADLSEEGKIAAKEVKERLQEELKAALKKVKRGNTAERKRLRELYAKKYEAELEQIRQDKSMVKASKQKKQRASAGGSTSKGSSKKTPAKKAMTKQQRMAKAIMDLKAKFPKMTDKQRVETRKVLLKMIEEYRKKYEG